ncbi:hypothetical protein TNCV_3875401 [Trichonephila clavipes]|uniref:Uncharacterized protein n=1 Tax=Trichonephila clavipes TaxID=2585209 RepID=A0A8X6T0G9_TRICX|nr:hypothetical protein TNCV_3875401 [Trichonephila clavipes]
MRCVPSCEKCWMQVSPVPASDEVCLPVCASYEMCSCVSSKNLKGFVKGILETGGVMDKCVQMWTKNYGALGQTARVCFGVLCANRTREVKRDFGDLPIRRSEGRVVNTPLVFKRVLFQEIGGKRKREKKDKKDPGERTDERFEKEDE